MYTKLRKMKHYKQCTTCQDILILVAKRTALIRSHPHIDMAQNVTWFNIMQRYSRVGCKSINIRFKIILWNGPPLFHAMDFCLLSDKLQCGAVITRLVFSKICTKYSPLLAREGDIYVCCDFKTWFTFCHCFRSAECNIVISWTAL